MAKEHRRRDKSILVRMDNSEYEHFRTKLTESGLSQQEFLLGAICGAQISSSDDLSCLKDISRTFAGIQTNIRELENDFKNLSRNFEYQDVKTNALRIEELSQQFNDYRKESDAAWRSLRLLIAQPNQNMR